MFEKFKKDDALAARGPDPFALLRQMTADMDRMFGTIGDWPLLRRPFFRAVARPELAAWFPKVDMFEKGNRLVTRVDLPGMEKKDVSVEVTDGCLVIAGERKREKEETEDEFYRSEREYGRFYRAIPLPEHVTLEDVTATFVNGVLEVSVPLPVRTQPPVRKVEIEEPEKAVLTGV